MDEQDICNILDPGTVLYFQSLKTFIIMFLMLSMINAPLYFLFSKNMQNGIIDNEIGHNYLAYFSRANTYEDTQTFETQFMNVTGLKPCGNEKVKSKKKKKKVSALPLTYPDKLDFQCSSSKNIISAINFELVGKNSEKTQMCKSQERLLLYNYQQQFLKETKNKCLNKQGCSMNQEEIKSFVENFSCFCREAAKEQQVDGSTENTLIVKATCQ